MTSDAQRVQLRQTDPVGSLNGTMVKSSGACQDVNFRPRYHFILSGKSIDINTGQVSASFSSGGFIENHGGDLTIMATEKSGDSGKGSADVDDDCFVRLRFTISVADANPTEMNFRGILVNDGRELLGMAIDPGTAISLRLSEP